MSTCPSDDQKRDYLLGNLTPEGVESIAAHVDSCTLCLATLMRLESTHDTIITELREAATRQSDLGDPALEQLLAWAAALAQPVEELSPAGDSGANASPLAAVGGAVVESAEQFVGQLLEAGLASAAQVEAIQQDLPLVERPSDARGLARLAVLRGLLTEFQADLCCQGNASSLVFGEYVVVDRIGAGGMGLVFKAQHRRMERIVALKVLPPAAMRSPQSVKRFHREVKAAARLSHPNIVVAHDAGEAGGQHYLVMEYVDGENLAKRVRSDGPMSVDEALDYTLQAARGLGHAHAQGIVHRDIKPANLLVDAAGLLKILDMGLAHIDRAKPSSGPDDGITATGSIMGTIDFMPPEQALDSKRADARSDTYSLGCTLFFLLSGRKLYEADTIGQMLAAHRTAPIPSLGPLRRDVPLALEAVYRKMVAKRPEQRFRTMQDVVAALEIVQATRQTSTSAAAKDRRSPGAISKH